MAIFVAMVLDGLDGRVARLTRTQSAFGAEYDSLSDMVSFGVAPALVVYEWCACKGHAGHGFAAGGSRPSSIAPARRCGSRASTPTSKSSTSASSRDCRARLPRAWSRDWCGRWNEYQIEARADVRWLAWALTVFAGLTMVSNFKFYSGKDINLRKSVPFCVRGRDRARSWWSLIAVRRARCRRCCSSCSRCMRCPAM